MSADVRALPAGDRAGAARWAHYAALRSTDWHTTYRAALPVRHTNIEHTTVPTAHVGDTGERVDANDLDELAGRCVTRLYHTADPRGETVDRAHGRLHKRTHGRGTIPAGDPDVTIIVAAAIASDLNR